MRSIPSGPLRACWRWTLRDAGGNKAQPALAPDPGALPRGRPTPNPELLPFDPPLEALFPHRAGSAQCLGFHDGRARLRVEHLGVKTSTRCIVEIREHATTSGFPLKHQNLLARAKTKSRDTDGRRHLGEMREDGE